MAALAVKPGKMRILHVILFGTAEIAN